MTLVHRLLDRELVVFLAVGGSAYLVDVAVFNLLLSTPPSSAWDPVVSRLLAVAVAMVVTFVGNATLTWRDSRPGRREVVLFVVVNVIGLGISAGCLALSHDVLGLRSHLADNVSANGVGLLLGTVFRYVTYSRLVFGDADTPVRLPTGGGRHGRDMTSPTSSRGAS